MRAAQERLPPKKRDLPAASGAEAGGARGGRGGGGGEAPASSPPPSPSVAPAEWAGGASHGGAGGLTVDQYGLVYKVAAMPPVVSVSPLPPAFSVASPLLPHPGLSYSPVHYAPLAPAPLHFVGSPYSLPSYTQLPPGFLPAPLLPSGAGLAAARIPPHFVPFAPLLLEEAGQPAHSFGKAPPALRSQLPVQYQLAHLPAAYSAFEAPGTEPCGEHGPQDPGLSTANGLKRPTLGEACMSEALDAAGQPEPRTTAGEATSAHHSLTCHQWLRTEVSLPSQRSTPDTDLEVQRVVGEFASQGSLPGSGQQEDGLSPLNLSHRDLEGKGEGLGRRLGRAAAAAKSHPQRLSATSPEELVYHHQILRDSVLANGQADSGSLQPAAPDCLGGASPEAPARGGAPDVDHHTPFQGHLPSHFMKGAVIQLATGELKRVEELQTQDFVRSAEVSGGLKIDSSTVVDLQESPWQGFVTLHFVVGEQQSKVSIDVPPEHPFFVYGQGWSSCSPERTARLFALPCHRLQVGDVCISISLQSLNGRLALQAAQGPPRDTLGRTGPNLQEVPAGAGRGESPVTKEAPPLGAAPEPSHLRQTAQYSWAGPSSRGVGEEPQSPLTRLSFIPQDVKLSIEGRSNAGK